MAAGSFAQARTTYPDTGYEPINVEHSALSKRFQAFIGNVNAGARDKATEELRLCVVGVKEHFAHEEEFMRKAQYPPMARHVEAHAIFVKDAEKFLAELEKSGITPSLRRWAVSRLHEWFWFHVKAYDIGLGQFLKKKEAGTAPAPAAGVPVT